MVSPAPSNLVRCAIRISATILVDADVNSVMDGSADLTSSLWMVANFNWSVMTATRKSKTSFQETTPIVMGTITDQ